MGRGMPCAPVPQPRGTWFIPWVSDGGATAGWRICRGHYLMLWVNGGTAANSGARNPLPPPGTGSVPVTHPLAGPGTSPRQLPSGAAGRSDSQTMGDVQKVSGVRWHPTSSGGCAAPALSGGARRAGRAGLCLGHVPPVCPGAGRGLGQHTRERGNWGWADLLWGHPSLNTLRAGPWCSLRP